MLFGVEPDDPGIFFAVLVSLVLVVMLAGDLPARSAARLNPIVFTTINSLRCAGI
jgi:hypothetical protein